MNKLNKSYLISCNGTIHDYNILSSRLCSYDKVISVDGGIRHLKMLNILPDISIGDFDSLDNSFTDIFHEKTEIIRYPEDKDATDTELAVNYALKNNARSITMIGFSGTRLDHSLSNIFLLSRIPSGIKFELIDEKNMIYLTDSRILLKSRTNSYVSVLPITQTAVISSSKGLLYDLTGKTLEFGSSLSVSNRANADEFSLTIKEGKVLIFISQD